MAPSLTHPMGVNFIDEQKPVNTDAATYYGGEEQFSRSRTYSAVRLCLHSLSTLVAHTSQSFAHGYNPKRAPAFNEDWIRRSRRMSHDEKGTGPRRFLIDVEETIRVVLEQEDTDGDFQISVTDAGPKLMSLGTATSNGFKTFDIRVSDSAPLLAHTSDFN